MAHALREDFQNLKKFLDLNLEPEPQPEQMGLL
jgi:hypothetical protein